MNKVQHNGCEGSWRRTHGASAGRVLARCGGFMDIRFIIVLCKLYVRCNLFICISMLYYYNIYISLILKCNVYFLIYVQLFAYMCVCAPHACST